MIVEVKCRVQRPALACLRWVKTGKAQGEHLFSADHPTTDIDRLRAKIMIYAQIR
jgi:hypothetical protein